jgi:hypothetical protein
VSRLFPEDLLIDILKDDIESNLLAIRAGAVSANIISKPYIFQPFHSNYYE